MPRLSIDQLPPCDARFDCARVPEAMFETRAATRHEDAVRARILRKNLPKGMGWRAARKLARRLVAKPAPRTMASSRCMRSWRRRCIGALWKLIAAAYPTPVSTVTIIKRGISVPSDQLPAIDPRVLAKQLRTDLDRAGGIAATCWGFFFLHGEYEPTSDRYILHFHGVVVGDMIRVIDKLRKQRKYKSTKIMDPTDHVKQRVRRSHDPLSNMPYPLTYVSKSYWPERRIGEVGYSDDGEVKVGRTRRGKRIRSDLHAAWLLWMHSLSVDDLSLLYGIRCSQEGLVCTNETVHETAASPP